MFTDDVWSNTVLSDGVNNTEDPYEALRALRKVRHEKMQKQLFILDKEARLRSGARGLQARKALVEYEKAVAESAARYELSIPIYLSTCPKQIQSVTGLKTITREKGKGNLDELTGQL